MNLHHRKAGLRPRQGFTLVELLVALALIVFIMAILSQAFAAATKTFRDLKAAGDLAERLRMVTGRLHRELAAYHCAVSGSPIRLSSPNFWTAANGATPQPPDQGYFCVYQEQINGSTPALDYVTEGTQANTGIPSTRAATSGLAFTMLLQGNDWSSFFSTTCALDTSPLSVLGPALGPWDSRYQPAPGTVQYTSPSGPSMYLFNSQWAEAAIFVQPSGNSTPPDANGNSLPLFNLYHRLRLAVTDNSTIPAQSAANNSQNLLFAEVSCEPDPANNANLYFNTPTDLTVPQRRFGGYPTNPGSVMPVSGTNNGPGYQTLAAQGATGALANADLLLTDVLSFEVRLLFGNLNSGGQTLNGAQVNPTQPYMTLWDVVNGGYGFTSANSTVPANVLVFDTWSKTTDTALVNAGAKADYSTWNTQNTATTIPLWSWTQNTGPSILAIQITLRIWDTKSQLTRQVSLVQAL